MSPTTMAGMTVEAVMPETVVPESTTSKAEDVSANGSNTRHGKGKDAHNGTGRQNGKAKTQLKSKAQLAVTGSEKLAWQIVLLPVDYIEANPYQPRMSFDPLEMAELTASVKVYGVQQPIIVRTCNSDAEAVKSLNGKAVQNGNRAGNGKESSNGHSPTVNSVTANPIPMRYQLVAGERRLRACREAGRKVIPAILRDDLSDVQVAEIALLENVQRSNLTVIEEARGYKRLMLEFRLKEERIAKKVGKSVQTVKDTIRLLALPEEVQTLLAEKKLTASHGHELLSLVPFETVCLSVARHAASAPLTATALAATPLPNTTALKAQGQIIELDYRTKFDWTNVCGSCPQKAYVRNGHSSYCLKPLEWKAKQEAAIELQKQEAARVLEEARQSNKSTVETNALPVGSFRDLSYVQLPAGCSGSCPCRGEADDPRDPTQKIQICLDPNRLAELKEAEREAHEELRRQRATALWNEAKAVLESEQAQGDYRKAVSLLVLPTLYGRRMGFYGDPEAWQQMVEKVAGELEITISWEEFFDPETSQTTEFTMLQTVEPDRLLLLAACVVLAYEVSESIRFGGRTPNLSLVLEHEEANQGELEESEDEITNFLNDWPSEDELRESAADEALEDGTLENEALNDENLGNAYPYNTENTEGLAEVVHFNARGTETGPQSEL